MDYMNISKISILKREASGKSKLRKDILWLGASASAEFFADIALCPMEMLKLKMQIPDKSGLWSGSFLVCLKNMYKLRWDTKFPFGSLRPLWSRQIPYTMAKFYFFEKIADYMYNSIFKRHWENHCKCLKLGITFISGYLSGVICTIVSQPADAILTQLGRSQASNNLDCVRMIYTTREIGVKNLLTAGLGARMIMIGTLTGMQWWVYDAYKTFMGIETSRRETSK